MEFGNRRPVRTLLVNAVNKIKLQVTQEHKHCKLYGPVNDVSSCIMQMTKPFKVVEAVLWFSSCGTTSKYESIVANEVHPRLKSTA